MNAKTFKKKWQNAKTLGEADTLVEQMTADEIQSLITVLKAADDWVELDMKDRFLLNHTLPMALKYNTFKKDVVIEQAYGQRAVEKLEGST